MLAVFDKQDSGVDIRTTRSGINANSQYTDSIKPNQKVQDDHTRDRVGSKIIRVSWCSIQFLGGVILGAFLAAVLLCIRCNDYRSTFIPVLVPPVNDTGSITLTFQERTAAAKQSRANRAAEIHNNHDAMQHSESKMREATCTVTGPKVKKDFSADIVLISSFPRSGNSWTRSLIHGATQYLDHGHATILDDKGTFATLQKFTEYTTCKTCHTQEISSYIRRVLGVRLDPGIRDYGEKVKIGGINDKVNTSNKHCVDTMTLAHTLNEHDLQSIVPPISVKSHYPVCDNQSIIGDFTQNVTKVIHLVRNPFDNIASRFLGHHHTYEKRWVQLQRAVARGENFPVFDTFVKQQTDDYVRFHEYWLTRRITDAAKGIPTFYTRYESLCDNTRNVALAMVTFGGWDVQMNSFECTLEELPCVVDGNTIPQHLNVYSEELRAYVVEHTKHIFKAFGYVFNNETKKMEYTTPEIPMCL
eukprot:m.339238 g.339238  ORF g.339238 m.339238 type:complete len:472 (+) comp20579_c0_seq2:213-1628(+)